MVFGALGYDGVGRLSAHRCLDEWWKYRELTTGVRGLVWCYDD